MTENYVKNKLSIITQKVSDALLKQERPEEPIALYILYYNTANWQNTNQPKCTTHFAAKKLHWGIRKVRRAKKVLVNLGLVEDVRAVHPKTKKVTGYYIKMNYKFKAKSESKVNELMELNTEFTCLKSSSAVKPVAPPDTTNALNNNNLNALSKVKKKEKTMLKTYKAKKSNKKYRHMFGSFDDIISYYSDGNWALKLKMKDFVQMRYAIGRKLSYPSLVGIFDRLNDLSGENYFAKIDMLDKSIRNGWADVYELNQEEWEEAWRRFRHNDPQKYGLVTGQHYEATELDYYSG